MKMFEEDIKDKVKNINLFEIVYKKDSFVLKGNEYPLGYTSYIAIQEECRFIDENLFKALLGIYDDLLHDFTMENLDYYHKGIVYVLNSLKDNPMFALLGIDNVKDKIARLFSEKKKNHYLAIHDFQEHGIDLSTEEKANYADEVMHSLNDFLSAMAIGEIIYNSVLELKEYAALVFQITHRIVERGARSKSQLADAFNDFLTNEYMRFIFRTDTQPFKTRATVMPVIENVDGENYIFRKIYYNNLKDFLMTDLFEGYIQGHYLWRCDICDGYFFMQTAHKQLYSSTVNPKYGVPCSYVAKHPEVVKRKMERQKKTDSPYYLLWRKRNDLIRKNKSLGKYDEAVSAKAKEYIDDCFEEALIDFEYAETQFEKDMDIENIYMMAKEMLDV